MSDLLSYEILEELRDQVGIELIASLEDELAHDAGSRINEIEKLHAAQSFDALRKEAHTLKSSSGTLGLQKVSELAAFIERTLVQKTGDDIDSTIPTLKPLFDESMLALKTWIQENS